MLAETPPHSPSDAATLGLPSCRTSSSGSAHTHDSTATPCRDDCGYDRSSLNNREEVTTHTRTSSSVHATRSLPAVPGRSSGGMVRSLLVTALLLHSLCFVTCIQPTDRDTEYVPAAAMSSASHDEEHGSGSLEQDIEGSVSGDGSELHMDELLPTVAVTKELFWLMRGKKKNKDMAESTRQSAIVKRDVGQLSDWGSNPYLIGKRFYKQPSFWTARGKKDAGAKVEHLSAPQENTEYADGSGDGNTVLYESLSGDVIPLYLDSPKSFERSNYIDANPWSSVGDYAYTGHRVANAGKYGLFWPNRGRRAESTVEETSAKRASPVKLSPLVKENIDNVKTNNGNSKFWMTRGRRFWASRGKKFDEKSLLFNRISRLVNSGLTERHFYGSNYNGPQKDMTQMNLSQSPRNPNFWFMRGKKSESSVKQDDVGYPDYDEVLPDDVRQKKAFSHLKSKLGNVNFRRGYRTPGYWARKGQKNFWAMRGKRSTPEETQ